LALFFGALVTSGSAIVGGQPDGNGHPYAALLLAPGLTFCSGTLISERTILTAGHCTDLWSELEDSVVLDAIQVTFDPQASVAHGLPNGGTWYSASDWLTYPTYDGDAWPFTYDYGLLFLDEPVDIEPANLPAPGALTPIIASHGQTDQRFQDVGYGVQGMIVGGGPPLPELTWTRTFSIQRYAPGNGPSTALLHPTWFIVNNQPSPRHGGACSGDSGSPVLFADTDTIVAVYTAGFGLGHDDVICGRKTSLNHRVDLPEVLAWIAANSH
jgi:hypothetical protein